MDDDYRKKWQMTWDEKVVEIAAIKGWNQLGTFLAGDGANLVARGGCGWVACGEDE